MAKSKQEEAADFRSAAEALATGGTSPPPPPAIVVPPGGRAEPAKVVGWARLCSPNDRAEPGARRYKLRLDGHPSGARTQRYVMGTSRELAHAEYLRVEGVPADAVDGKGVQVVTVELPD